MKLKKIILKAFLGVLMLSPLLLFSFKSKALNFTSDGSTVSWSTSSSSHLGTGAHYQRESDYIYLWISDNLKETLETYGSTTMSFIIELGARSPISPYPFIRTEFFMVTSKLVGNLYLIDLTDHVGASVDYYKLYAKPVIGDWTTYNISSVNTYLAYNTFMDTNESYLSLLDTSLKEQEIDDIWNDGYYNGINDPENPEYDVRYDMGFDAGYSEGISANLTEDASGLFSSIGVFIGGIFGIEIFPNVTIGVLVSIPIMLAVLRWLFLVLGKKS